MKKNKRFKSISLILVLLIVLLISGCNKKEEEISILTPEGIPCIALGESFDNSNYKFTTVTGSDLISSNLVNGEYDVIISPIIMGAQLYTKDTSKYQLSSILTLGNSYLLCREKDKITSLKELEGNTVASYGKNTAPDIVLRASLVSQGVDLSKVDFVYENGVPDVFTNRFLVKDPVKYILSAEPVISKMEIKKFSGEEKLVKIDLQEILKNEIDVIPQAGIFVKKGLKKDISTFLENIEKNVNSLNENPKEYASDLMKIKNEKVSIFNSLTEIVIEKSIPGSNITFMNGKNNKETLDKYFNMINTYNKNILGGKSVDENFYY